MRNWAIMAKERLDKLVAVVFFGAGQDILKPKKTGRWLADFLNWLDNAFLKLFDSVDTRFLFKGRAVKTKKGRVRSRYERKVVDFFEENNIEYVYEPQLVLGKIKLHPDFYLPRYKVYVEFWGMADFSPSYQRYMARKLKLYSKHNVPLISIYPRHLKDMRKSFFKLLERTTGKNIRKEICGSESRQSSIVYSSVLVLLQRRKVMRTIFIGGLVLVVLALFVIPGLWMHAKGVPEAIGDKIAREIPDDWVIREAREELGKKKKELRAAWASIYGVKAKMDGLVLILRESKEELLKKEQILKRLKGMLEENEPGSIIPVAGVEHKWDDVNQDALNCVSSCEVLRRQIAGNEQSLSILRQSYDDCNKTIATAHNDLRQLETQLGMDEVKLAVDSAQKEARAIADQVYKTSGRLASSKDDIYSPELVRRLNRVDADMEYERQFGPDKKSRIDWEKEFGLTEKATGKIDSYFKEDKPSQPESEKQ